MKATYLWVTAAVVVVAGTALRGLTQPDLPWREVRIKGGRTALYLLPTTLKQSKLGVDFHKSKTADCDSCSLPGFQFSNGDLQFRVVDGKVTGFDQGKISHKGVFNLTGGGKTIRAEQMTIAPKGHNGDLSLAVESSNGSFVAFDVRKPKMLVQTNPENVVFNDMEVLVSEDLAEELGTPELAGESVGSITLYANYEPADGGGAVEYAEASPEFVGIDIKLSAMGSLSVASNPTAKVGAYPTGRTGLTMSTTSCNVGTVNIPWNAPMLTTHPVIALNLYRQLNGRFEQVGWSWLKHGFLSTNSNGCGSCQNPGTGALLGINCSDTYGPGNNGDRTYLGGRDEVNPFTGVWTCTNSWFSNYLPDCTRRNPGAVTLDAVDHRLDCLDVDLGNANARYFYEAFYITPDDINTYNNLGSREATISWNGSSWVISTTTAMLEGPAIQRWGDTRSTATPQTEGDVIVAVQVTNNGNGTWHFEYAVYNHNLDRQVREFSVPLPYGAQVSNVGFHDIDRDAGNAWVATQTDHALTWSSPTFGSANTNPLKYSSVFNFSFDTNVQPATTTNRLGLFKPGQLTNLNAATNGPLFLEPVDSFSPITALVRAGNLASLEDADGDRVKLGVIGPASINTRGISTSDTAPAGAITQITMGVRSYITLQNRIQKIELFNWSTNLYEVVDSRPAPLIETTAIFSITTNANRFVNTSTREVKARIVHTGLVNGSLTPWDMYIDQVGFHYN